jgi:catechol 2,3-dioxygenase-like lactoylglutathione lyase family enzyme
MLAGHAPISFIAAKDLDVARHFYESILGLKYLEFDGFALKFQIGANHLRIAKVEAPMIAPYTVLGWRTDQIDLDVAALAARGVQFVQYPYFSDTQDSLGIWASPDGAKVAWFKDPDGNLLSLAQYN